MVIKIKMIQLFGTIVEGVTVIETAVDVIHSDKKRPQTFIHHVTSDSSLPPYFLCLLHFGLFTFAEGKDSQQGGKQQPNKMQTVGAIVYFFKNGAHVSFPEEWGGGAFTSAILR